MLNGVGIQHEIRNEIYAECASTASFQSSISVKRTETWPRMSYALIGMHTASKKLRTFNEMAVVTTKDNIPGL